MRAGLGRLGLPPRDFWSMTLRELDAALRGHLGLDTATQPFSRAGLRGLMRAFPD
jgi:uncharacterized phage protein (TIGR02216 family)